MRPLYVLTKEQEEEIARDLLQFIHRVALDKNASPAEIAALPEVAKVLMWMIPLD